MSSTYLLFMLGEQHYGVNVLSVKSVMRGMDVSTIPWSPDAILGIAQKRGQIITVLDLEYLLGLHKRSHTKKQNVILLYHQDEYFGVVADEFKGMFEVDAAEVEMPLDHTEQPVNVGVAGLFYTEHHNVTLLETSLLFQQQYQEGAI